MSNRGSASENEVDSQNFVFMSYSSRDEFQVRQFSGELRKQNIPIFAYPYDLPGGADIVDGIKAQKGNKILALALSPNSIATTWMMREVERTVLEPFSETLSGVYLLILEKISRKEIRALPYHARYEVIDLSGANYAESVQAFAEKVGATKSASAPARKAVAVPAPFTMTGVFQPARPATELFTQLKRQIYSGEAIDQKYLYWDVRAVLRWQRIAELSGYMTVQMGMNLVAGQGSKMVDAAVADLREDSVSFINLGVGTGVKDYLILSELLERVEKVTYFAVDESFPMIQLTMQTLEELLSGNPDRLRAHYIVDDIMNLKRHKAFIGDADPKILSFDNMLANFKEPDILGVIRDLMHERDRLLMGVEYVANRSDDILKQNYSDQRMKEFLYGPISDATGGEPRWEEFRYEVWPGGQYKKYSQVAGAKVIVGKMRLDGREVELFFSTKYSPEPLERYLTEQMGFEIVAAFKSQEEPPRYGMYILKLS